MPNYSNLLIQALVEANERKSRRQEDEVKLLKALEKEEIEDNEAEEEKDAADAEAEEALAELGEPTDDEVDDAEQEALEQEAEEIENLDDPSAYDPDGDEEPNEEELSDEELAALEAEDDQKQQEVPPDEVTPNGDPEAQTPEETVPPEEAPLPDADQTQQPEVNATDDPGQIPQEGDIPPEGKPQTDEMGDFDYDAGEEVPADGAVPQEGDPSADLNADQTAVEDPNAAPPDPDVQNIQVNILNLSKLDRALAKKHIYTLFMDLRSSVTTALNIIDRNETVIEPEVRADIVDRLNQFQSDLNTFIAIKFQLVNYEAALQAYNVFTEQFNSYINSIKNEDSDQPNVKHDNKGGR